MESSATTPQSVEESQRHALADFCRRIGNKTVRRQTRSGTDEKVAAFSPRIRQTLQRILIGDSEKQVALKLGVSQHTVHVYVKAIYRAFGASSRGELMTHFVNDKWLDAAQPLGPPSPE